MGSIYAHSYGQPILVRFSAQCIQRAGLCVLGLPAATILLIFLFPYVDYLLISPPLFPPP